MMPAVDGESTSCAIQDQRWACPPSVAGQPAVIVIVGESMIAARIIASSATDDSDDGIHRWGRVVRVLPGGVAPDDLHDLVATAWTVDRPQARPRTRRFAPVEQPSIRIVRLSDVAFWIAGDDADGDSFVSIEGPATARTTVAASALVESPPDVPVLLPAIAPQSLSGRVVGEHLEPVSDVEIELFEPMVGTEPKAKEDSAEMVRRAFTRTDSEGSFTMDRLAPGPYTLSAIEPTVGRGTLRVESLSEPAVVRLTPPARATGRVLRARVPVPDARIRFVPDPAALAGSSDVTQLLADATTTGADGAFILALPPQHDGIIQIVTPAGVSIRVPIPSGGKTSTVALGDIDVPEPRRVIVRLFGDASCILSAAGPLNGLGLAIVTAARTQNLYWFDLPEAGDWSLNAECDGVPRRTDPAAITVSPSAQGQSFDVRIVEDRRQP